MKKGFVVPTLDVKEKGVSESTGAQVKSAVRPGIDPSTPGYGELLKTTPVQGQEHRVLDAVKAFEGGRMGKAFKLTHTGGAESVVKLQGEHPGRVIAAQKVMERAGVNVAKSSVMTRDQVAGLAASAKPGADAAEAAAKAAKAATASGDEKKAAAEAAKARAGEGHQALHSYLTGGVSKPFPYALTQELVRGSDIQDVWRNPEKLFGVLQTQQFGESTGRIFAADVFSGNTDRMNPVSTDEHAFVHAENLKVGAGGEARPIDNDFVAPRLYGAGPFPSKIADHSDFQAYAGNPKLRQASGEKLFDRLHALAKAPPRNQGELEEPPVKEGEKPPALARYEAAHAAFTDEWIKRSAREQHKDKPDPGTAADDELARIKKDERLYTQKKADALASLKSDFAGHFASGGAAASKALMERGQGWKQQLVGLGIGNEEMTNFRDRKRYLRLLNLPIGAGDQHGSPEKAFSMLKPKQGQTTKDPTQAYRETILREEKKLKPERAERIAADPVKYKAYMRSKLPRKQRIELAQKLNLGGSQEEARRVARHKLDFRKAMREHLSPPAQVAPAAPTSSASPLTEERK